MALRSLAQREMFFLHYIIFWRYQSEDSFIGTLKLSKVFGLNVKHQFQESGLMFEDFKGTSKRVA